MKKVQCTVNLFTKIFPRHALFFGNEKKKKEKKKDYLVITTNTSSDAVEKSMDLKRNC